MRLKTNSIALIVTRKPSSASVGDASRVARQPRDVERCAVLDQRAEAEADADDHERHRRSGRGDPKLGARRVGVARHPRHAAEEPQVDAADLDPLAARDERMAELVQDQRREEQHHRSDGDDVGLRHRSAELVAKPVRAEVDEEEEDDEPARARADPDAEDAQELDRASRIRALPGSSQALGSWGAGLQGLGAPVAPFVGSGVALYCGCVAGDDRLRVDAGRERAVLQAGVAGEAGGAERVGDGGRRVAHEQRALQREGHALDDAPGALLDRVRVAELVAQRRGERIEPGVAAGRLAELVEVRVEDTIPADAAQRAQHVERHDVARALPDRGQRHLAVQPRHAGLLDVAVAAEALERLERVARAALADPVLADRGPQALERRCARVASRPPRRTRAPSASRAPSPPRTRCRGPRERCA